MHSHHQIQIQYANWRSHLLLDLLAFCMSPYTPYSLDSAANMTRQTTNTPMETMAAIWMILLVSATEQTMCEGNTVKTSTHQFHMAV